MTARPVFVKLAAFFFAFAAAVALAALFTPAPLHRPPRACGGPALSCYPADEFALAENLQGEVELVTLDREARRSYARLTLRLVGNARAPARLRVRTYFFDPSDPSGLARIGDEVELLRPFAEGRSIPVTVSAPCSWCKDAPAGNYFARVEFREDCEDWENCAATSFPRVPPGPGPLFDIRSAAPVVVHAERVPPARR